MEKLAYLITLERAVREAILPPETLFPSFHSTKFSKFIQKK